MFKVGDRVLLRRDAVDAATEAHQLRLDGSYTIQSVDTRGYVTLVGMYGGWVANRFDLATDPAPVPLAPPAAKIARPRCRCELRQLMAVGCKCGGV
jgi:hypothetical protein